MSTTVFFRPVEDAVAMGMNRVAMVTVGGVKEEEEQKEK